MDAFALRMRARACSSMARSLARSTLRSQPNARTTSRLSRHSCKKQRTSLSASCIPRCKRFSQPRKSTDRSAAAHPAAKNTRASVGTSTYIAANAPTTRIPMETRLGTKLVAPSVTTATSEVIRLMRAPVWKEEATRYSCSSAPANARRRKRLSSNARACSSTNRLAARRIT